MSGAISAGTLATIAGIGAAGSIGSSLISSSAAGKAANAQSSAANYAAQLQYQASQDALNFEKQQYQQSQNNLAPYLQSGYGGLANLDYLLGIAPPTTQGATTGTAAATAANADNSLKPRYLNDTYSGSINGSDSSSQWKFVGQNGTQDIYERTNGSPAWYSRDANGWGQGGKGSPGFQVQTTASPSTGSTSTATGAGNNPTGNSGSSSWNTITPRSGPVASMQGTESTGVATPTAATDTSGTTNLSSMVNPSLGAFGSLMQPYGKTFTAPTDITEQNDPGFQARLKLGTDAIERSAAARGGVVTGGTAQGLNQFAQDYASNEYNNVYNRAWNEYAQGYNQYEQQQTNQYNRLASLAGIGQQTAQQLSTLGTNTANNVSNNILSTAQNMGSDYQNAAAANASGYVGSANAWSGALQNGTNSLSNLLLLKSIYG